MAISKSLIAFALFVVMALAASSEAQNTPQDFVNLHNKYRAADGVGPVTWDSKQAKYAKNYAAKRAGDCSTQHSGGQYGENIYWGSSGRASAADAVKKWVDEKANYHYSTNTCTSGKVCGHYTQVVWRKSTRIGCARVVCTANCGVFIICS